jgi:hypothetical protein
VGSPIPPYSQRDPDTQGKGKIPDKEAALVLLHALLALPPYVPKGGVAGRAPAPAGLPEDLEDLEELEEPEEEAGTEGDGPPSRPLPREVEKRLRELLEEGLSSRPRRTDGEDARTS